MKEIQITISKSKIELEILNNDGTVEIRQASANELLKIIDSSQKRKKSEIIDSNLLPNGLVRVLESHDRLVKGYFVHTKKGIVPFRYYDKIFLIKDFCPLLFYIVVDREKILKSYVYVLKDTSISNEMQIYKYPFGNVSRDGHICFGNNSLPLIKGPKDLEQVISIFFASSSNDDYFRNSDKVLEKYYSEQAILLSRLRDGKVKMEDILVPYCTMNELVKKAGVFSGW